MRFRNQWNTRLGFYVAAISSAFGLGNLWRFPYVVAENGGGAFVLLYVFLVFLVGIPILIGELILGKSTQQSIVGAFRQILSPQENSSRWLKLFGRLAVFTSLVVLSYYAVISGWVLHFFMQYLVGMFRLESFEAQQSLGSLKQSGFLQVSLASVHLLVTMMIVMKGVQNRFERWVGYTMPVFALLLVLLVIQALSLPTSTETLRFLFYPDFSRLTLSSVGQAIGHVLFTLSIGFGIMVTFGSYMKRDVRVAEAGLRFSLADTLVSLTSALVIFPVVLQFQLTTSGPEMLFQALPHFFSQFTGGHLAGIAFFFCLYLAALTATIGLLEAIVSNLGDRWGWSRRNAAFVGGLLSFVVAIAPALSSSVLADLRWRGKSVLEITDLLLINWLLPVVAIGLCWVVGRYVSQGIKEKEFFSAMSSGEVSLFENWQLVIRWLGPLVIVIGLVLQVVDFFKN